MQHVTESHPTLWQPEQTCITGAAGFAENNESKEAPAYNSRAQPATYSIALREPDSAGPHYPTNLTSHSEMGGNASSRMVRSTSLTRKGITPL